MSDNVILQGIRSNAYHMQNSLDALFYFIFCIDINGIIVLMSSLFHFEVIPFL